MISFLTEKLYISCSDNFKWTCVWHRGHGSNTNHLNPISYRGRRGGSEAWMTNHIISYHSETPYGTYGTNFKLGVFDPPGGCYRRGMLPRKSIHQGDATADFMSGPTDWGIKFCFVLLGLNNLNV